uniref:Hint domain-containing protein n=1 Tax=Acrobeloides nanus TaxID=290746 RepID=A0A914EDQ0_9BILA
MELGEKLLQKQLAALYPNANPNQNALDAARTGAEDNNIEKKTAVKCIEIEDDSDNDKEIRRSFLPMIGSNNCNTCDCGCKTCSCYSSCCSQQSYSYSASTCNTCDCSCKTCSCYSSCCTQQSYYYPVNNCNGCNCGCQTCSCYSNCCNQFSCFTADTKVRTVDGKNIRMDELSLEDWVLSPNKTDNEIIYTPMESWIHRLPSAYTSFIKFTLEDGKTLKITNKHFIYKSSCESRFKNITIEDLPINPVYAEKVDVNDCLYVVDQVYNKSIKQFASWMQFFYGKLNHDELDIPSATPFLVDMLQYVLPNSIVPS